MPVSSSYRPDPRFMMLGPEFADPVAPADFPKAETRFRNDRWAARIGLETLSPAEWTAAFARFQPLPDNQPEPLALRYHGHQFQSYNPQLGDGRGFLYAQQREAETGRLLDLGTKGSGRTPYSRSGDGRLTLKGGVREVLATAVLTRLSYSNIRFGTFQRHAYFERSDLIAQLIDHVVELYYPHLAPTEGGARAAALLAAVVQRTAELVARWMAAGFVHGVLNTDNMNINGESFDYGPYRFLPYNDPEFTAAYFDQTGLYAFGRQPAAVFWNLQQLAACLQPLADPDDLVAALNGFGPAYRDALASAMLARLGLTSAGSDADAALASAAFGVLQAGGEALRWEPFFFDWFGGEASAERALEGARASMYKGPPFEAFRARLADHAPERPERLESPYFARTEPEELLYDEIEAIWSAISDRDDWAPFDAKLAGLEQARAALGIAREVPFSASEPI
jgi:uncharacterized protein YdiU (UPF0061 family)